MPLLSKVFRVVENLVKSGMDMTQLSHMLVYPAIPWIGESTISKLNRNVICYMLYVIMLHEKGLCSNFWVYVVHTIVSN